MKNPKTAKIVGIVLLIVSFFSIGFMSGNLFGGDLTQKYIPGYEITGQTSRDLEELDFNLFWDVWGTLKSEYVDGDSVDEKEMFYGAIAGMVDSFGDPATLFLDPEETSLFNDNSAGKYFEGIGAELGYNELGQIIVVTPIDGAPAKDAGLMQRDIILKVDGEDIEKDSNIYDVVFKIRGEAGSDIVLTVLSIGDLEEKDITITRGPITVPSMALIEVEENKDIVIMDISRFTDASLPEWEANWNSLVKEVKASNAKGVVLDLRGNPGGFFDAAIYAAGEFLPRGTEVAHQEDRQGARDTYKVARSGDLLDIPVVVLIDSGSASASEILAGALQQSDRVTVIGEKTYGKGTAQTVLPLDGGSSLHVTILKWLLPDGTWLNRDNPIVPDIEIEFDSEAFKAGEDPQLDKALEELN